MFTEPSFYTIKKDTSEVDLTETFSRQVLMTAKSLVEECSPIISRLHNISHSARLQRASTQT